MGPRTDQNLLQPESALAIYRAMEALSASLNERVDGQNQKFDSQGRALERIQDGIDTIKDQLRDGRVTFAEHKGMIDTLDARVEDVESDVHKLFPQRKPPTGLHPTITKTPLHNRALTERVEKVLIHPKLINAFLLAMMAAVGTSVGGLIVARMNAAQFSDMVKTAIQEDKDKAETAAETAPPAPVP